ncbi:MAG TPA: glycine cleavage system protein GcvH [Streptosporangiaceae bacterium]
MTTPPPDAAGTDAVSPAIGPLPAIYVHVPARLGGTMSDIPADLRYSQEHLWVRPEPGGGLVRVGVTDFAQRSLGDVVEVTLPGLGGTLKAGQACGDSESVKSVSDLVAPVAGTVRARNDDLASTPELVNTDPYGQGWMFEAEIDPSTLDQQLASLMDAGAYRRLAGA